MNNLPDLENCTGFEWDEHNAQKNWIKHKVKPSECEQIFFNHPLFVTKDVKHSQKEPRYYALGHTDFGRNLFIVFTIHERSIRIISARDMSKKERKIYEKKKAENSQI